MSELLEISNVDQIFRTGFWMKRLQVLHSISLSVPERTVCGFLGANGAGKTTLIHLIVGLRRPARGTVKIRGIESTLAAARAKVGYLPERPYFHEHLTGDGLLRYMGSLSGMSRKALSARIPVVLAAVGLTEAKELELRKYSKGMLQRIGIAQAILHDPEFLVLDEPMSGLDPLGRKEIRELILKLSAEGRTIFFSSHVIPDVEAVCDQVAVIEKGRIVSSGSVHGFLSKGLGEKAAQTEIAFSGMSVSEAEALGDFVSLRNFQEGIRGVVTGELTDRVLARLLERRARVLWVTPLRPSLEDLIVKGEVRS